MFLIKCLLKCHSSVKRPLPWKLLVASLLQALFFLQNALSYTFDSVLNMPRLDNYSIICTVTLCYVLHQTRSEFWHVQNYLFRYIQAYPRILSIIKAYSCILRDCQGMFRLIYLYSAPFLTHAYSEPYHISRHDLLGTRGIFKTLWNHGVNQKITIGVVRLQLGKWT